MNEKTAMSFAYDLCVFVEVIFTNIKFRNISTFLRAYEKTRNWIAALRLLNSLSLR